MHRIAHVRASEALNLAPRMLAKSGPLVLQGGCRGLKLQVSGLPASPQGCTKSEVGLERADPHCCSHRTATVAPMNDQHSAIDLKEHLEERLDKIEARLAAIESPQLSGKAIAAFVCAMFS